MEKEYVSDEQVNLQRNLVIAKINIAATNVLLHTTTYEEFVDEMKKKESRGEFDKGYFNRMNNFHIYFTKEGPFWIKFLLLEDGAVTQLTRDNLRSIVQHLLDTDCLKKDEYIERQLIGARVVEEEREQDPELRHVSWEELYERAIKRETKVANFMFRCMKILIEEHGFEYVRDIEM